MSDKDSIREHLRIYLSETLQGMVDHPDFVVVECRIGDQTTVFHIKTDRRNFPQILGMKGRNINAVRVIMNAMCAKNGIRAVVELEHVERG